MEELWTAEPVHGSEEQNKHVDTQKSIGLIAVYRTFISLSLSLSIDRID